jgi:sialic acid synthase SpsE
MTKIIIEICQNHKGDRKILSEMIKQAAKNGADIVKMQSIFSDDLTRREQFEEGKTSSDGTVLVIKRPFAQEKERLSKLDLSLDDHRFFIKECKKHGIIPMTTIFARNRVQEVASLPWPKRIVKVASYDCPSFPFLRELCEEFDHLIVSTGASYDEEIKKAAALVKKAGKKLTLLHCVTSYPNTLQMCNLSRTKWLKKYSEKTGWSDHTLIERDGLIAAKAAIVLGADYIERHFTILPVGETKDGPVSITPKMLKELSDFRKKAKRAQERELDKEYPKWREELLGKEKRKLTHTEKLNRDYYRGRFAARRQDGSYWFNWESR